MATAYDIVIRPIITEQSMEDLDIKKYALSLIHIFLSHYAGYIRYFSKVHGQVNAEVEEYVKQQLIAALFKFRFDR